LHAINYKNFDFHKDVGKVDALLAELLNAVSTDLSDFRRRGNKLIMYHGWADPVIPSQASINYFNALVRHDSHGGEGTTPRTED
jgi:feruloyl esterase